MGSRRRSRRRSASGCRTIRSPSRCSRARGRSRRRARTAAASPRRATCDEIEATFGDARRGLPLRTEAARSELASTVVDLAHGGRRVLRAGAVSEDDIAEALRIPTARARARCRLAAPWQGCSWCAPATCAGRRSPRGCSARRSSNDWATRRRRWHRRGRWDGRVPAPTRTRSRRRPNAGWTSPVTSPARSRGGPRVGGPRARDELGARARGRPGGPEAAARTFTLKELVRLVEALPSPAAVEDLSARVEAADGLRGGASRATPTTSTVADPLGMPLESFRAVAWELEEWCGRLADGLVGRAPAARRARRGGMT